MSAPRSRTPLRRAVLVTLAIIVGLALFLVVVARGTEVGREAVADLAERARPSFLLAAIGLLSLAIPALAMRWRALLPTPPGAPRPHPLALAAMWCVGLLFNYALPGPAGDLLATVMVHRRYRIPMPDAMASMLVSRLLGLASAFGLAGTTALLLPGGLPEGAEFIVYGASGLCLAGFISVLVVGRAPHLLRTPVEWVAARISGYPGRLGALAKKLAGFALQLTDALLRTTARGWTPLLSCLLWSMCSHLLSATGVVMAAWAIGRRPAWIGVMFTYAASTAGAVLLFLFPGSQFVWDGSFATLMTVTTGMSLTDAGAVTLVIRIQQMMAVLVGVGALWLLARALLPSDEELAEAKVSAEPEVAP